MADLPDSPAEIVSRLIRERKPRPAIGNYCAPQDQFEAFMCDVWAEVLRIDQIGRDDNLFDLGGDSIHMARIAARIRRRFKVDIPVGVFFDDPTVSGLATSVRESLAVINW